LSYGYQAFAVSGERLSGIDVTGCDHQYLFANIFDWDSYV
jgi:hypothetical protein